MVITTAIISVVVFLFAFRLFGVVKVGVSVLTISREAIGVIHDSNLNDLEREKKLQHASLQLLRAFISIFVRSVLTLVVSFLPMWLISLMGLVSIEDVILYLSRWDVIVIITVVIIAFYYISSLARSLK